jgi:hypothetical protein
MQNKFIKFVFIFRIISREFRAFRSLKILLVNISVQSETI